MLSHVCRRSGRGPTACRHVSQSAMLRILPAHWSWRDSQERPHLSLPRLSCGAVPQQVRCVSVWGKHCKEVYAAAIFSICVTAHMVCDASFNFDNTRPTRCTVRSSYTLSNTLHHTALHYTTQHCETPWSLRNTTQAHTIS